MPDKVETGSFLLAHNDYDLRGGPAAGFATAPPLLPPGAVPPEFSDPLFPTLPPTEADPGSSDPQLGDVYWDFDLEAFFAYDGTEWTQLTLTGGGSSLPWWFDATPEDADHTAADHAVAIVGGTDTLSFGLAGNGDEGSLILLIQDLPTTDPADGTVWLSDA